jgi:hypothetical protein
MTAAVSSTLLRIEMQTQEGESKSGSSRCGYTGMNRFFRAGYYSARRGAHYACQVDSRLGEKFRVLCYRIGFVGRQFVNGMDRIRGALCYARSAINALGGIDEKLGSSFVRGLVLGWVDGIARTGIYTKVVFFTGVSDHVSHEISPCLRYSGVGES